MSDYGYDEALHGFDMSVRKLGVDYVDLLLHQPLASDLEKTIAAYKAIETLLADGGVRAIGVSNQPPAELDELIFRTEVVPAVHQIRVHPYYSQPECRQRTRYGILTRCWSPIGGSYTYNNAVKNPLKDSVITAIADTYSKTSAQVILRCHLEHGFSAIPKSVKPHRIAANFTTSHRWPQDVAFSCPRAGLLRRLLRCRRIVQSVR